MHLGLRQRGLRLVPALAVLVLLIAPSRPGLGLGDETGPPADGPKVRGTSHDLSHAGQSACGYCHLPEPGAAPPARPKWDRRATAPAFAAYGGTAQAPVAGPRPEGTSLVCLSCHDGTVAADQPLATAFGLVAPKGALGPVGARGHAVTVSYPRDWRRGFELAKNGRVGPLPLFGGERHAMGCASCHDPHYGAIAPYLRVSMSYGRLCTTCHIK